MANLAILEIFQISLATQKKGVHRALRFHFSLRSPFFCFFFLFVSSSFLLYNLLVAKFALTYVCVCVLVACLYVCLCCCPVATACCCCCCLGLISYRLYRFSLRIVRADKINDNKSAGNKLKSNKK